VGARPKGAGRDSNAHATLVDAWLDRSAKDLAPEVVVHLFEGAFVALWTRTKTTLGEVTLTAITERVFYNASEKFSVLSSLNVGPDASISFGDLRERMKAASAAELLQGVRFVLVEFLTVLGNLTAEILTPELHAELANVTPPQAVRSEAGSGKPS
jgi:hypothetical protein